LDNRQTATTWDRTANSLIVDEYLKNAKTPEDIRDGLTEVIGDLLMTLPVVEVAGYHTGQREAVYEKRLLILFISDMSECIPSTPNGPGLVNWPLYDRQKQEYMELGQAQTVRQNLKKDRVHFATVTLPQRLEQMAAAAAKAAN
ncbi:hypothetical protein XENOCAPTIV_004831, partial [Xenoophorus captivus]